MKLRSEANLPIIYQHPLGDLMTNVADEISKNLVTQQCLFNQFSPSVPVRASWCRVKDFNSDDLIISCGFVFKLSFNSYSGEQLYPYELTWWASHGARAVCRTFCTSEGTASRTCSAAHNCKINKTMVLKLCIPIHLIITLQTHYAMMTSLQRQNDVILTL